MFVFPFLSSPDEINPTCPDPFLSSRRRRRLPLHAHLPACHRCLLARAVVDAAVSLRDAAAGILAHRLAHQPLIQARELGMKIQSSGRSIDGLMEKVLSVNILSSDYFKEVYKFKTYHEVIDEIYHHVNHVEPWMTGNCRGPSSAFCLLYKFFTMKLTIKQMHGFLKHPDSTYIRVLMFLQLTVVEDGTSVETSRHLLEY